MITTMQKTEKVVKKDKSGSLENVIRENTSSRSVANQQNKLKVPCNIQERYSTGSPMTKLSTPIQNLVRNNDLFTKSCTPEIFTTVRFETPKRNTCQQISGEVEASNLVVAVRLRPLTAKEEVGKQAEPSIHIKGNEVNVITDYGQTHSFAYDHCFCGTNSKIHDQSKVYESLARPLLIQAFKGFNTCLFAYGQTGSGKSYSIMGTIGSNIKEITETSGIIPRFCLDLFRKTEALKKKQLDNLSIEIQISYFEIYKEKIQDLLCPTTKPGGPGLRVREHPQNGPYVVDLSKHTVDSFEEVQRWLVVGNRQRATAATSANERSSRSHAIFTVTLTQSFHEKLDGKSHEVRKQSRMNFIDLAGSERVASTHSIGDRREEGLTINQSLLTLGRVITALAEQNFVPYRESVLTWLLKESLGGDSKTVMLATVSPFPGHVEETLSTLRYACQARKIVNTARICEDSNSRYIRHLREQIKIMENRLAESNLPRQSAGSTNENSRILQLEEEISKLKSRLERTEFQEDDRLHERVVQAETKREEAEKALASYGLSRLQDPQQPCLVNVNQDPQLSGTLFFPLKPGKNWVGSSVATSDPPSIQITGIMIEEKHCCITVSEQLRLSSRAETYVNGQLVGNVEVDLHHGDRIIIGGTHYFHLHYPNDCKVLEKSKLAKITDFETAHEELRNVQEKVLQQAIKEAQDKARLQLLSEMEELRQEAALEMSLQKHSYEDEIATLQNRVQLDRQSNEISSPPQISPATNWEAIQALIQDSELKLLNSKNISEESPFKIQSMLNELNVICRKFHQPYTFSRIESPLTDESQSLVSVCDEDRQLVMYWTLDKMRQRLKIIREAIDETGVLTSDDIFEGGDVWQLEHDTSASYGPSVREELEKLLMRQESSITILDESRFSLDSSRRSSALLRSPTVNKRVADVCKDIVANFSDGDLLSRFVESASALRASLGRPDRSPNFALSLTVHFVSLMSIYPGLVDHLLSLKPDLSSSIRVDVVKQAKDLGMKLKNCMEFVMQGISLDSMGLLNEWTQRTDSTLDAILTSYFELAVLCNQGFSPGLLLPFASAAVPGFVSAQKKIHQSTIHLADDVRMKIAQLADESTISSLDNSSFMSNGFLVKACHDSVTQVLILLERFTDMIDSSNHETEFEKCYFKFHQRIDVLIRLGTSIENLFLYLELADLSQVKYHAAAMDVQTTSYTKLMDVDAATILCDVSFAIGTVQKIVAEKKRMTALRRGRDVIYSPLPARLLASPFRKSSNLDDDGGCGSQSSSLESVQTDEESSDDDDSPISPTAIRRALLFRTPSKSSLKNNYFSGSTKSVRFNVSDSPSLSS